MRIIKKYIQQNAGIDRCNHPKNLI
jgi:hypothetical protein